MHLNDISNKAKDGIAVDGNKQTLLIRYRPVAIVIDNDDNV